MEYQGPDEEEGYRCDTDFSGQSKACQMESMQIGTAAGRVLLQKIDTVILFDPCMAQRPALEPQDSCSRAS